MNGLYSIIRRKRRPLIQPDVRIPADGLRVEPVPMVAPVAAVPIESVKPLEISKPKKSRDDAPKN